MILAESANPEVTQELVRVKGAGQNALEPVTANQRKLTPLARPGIVPARNQPGKIGSTNQLPGKWERLAAKSGQRSSTSGSTVVTAKRGTRPTTDRTLSGAAWPSGIRNTS